MNTQLSLHFSLKEATDSNKATENNISNIPSAQIVSVMVKTASKMEEVRQLLKQPIDINSWYRCPELNIKVGSKSTSQHLNGEAVDFISPQFGTPTQIVQYLKANKDSIGFDQLILEHTWVHISFAILTSKPRGQVLSLLSDKSYAIGITDIHGNPIN